MPDGDRVYSTLPRLYHEVFEEIREGHFAPREIAHDVLGRLIHNVRTLGFEPIQLAFQVAAHLEPLPQGPLLSALVDWLEESRMIERCARQIDGQKRAMEYAVDACKRHLCAFQDGDHRGPHLPALVHGYLVRVYDAQFEQRAIAELARGDTDCSTSLATLHEMRPFVFESLRGLANTIIRTESLSHLRRPSRLRSRITATTNLLK